MLVAFAIRSLKDTGACKMNLLADLHSLSAVKYTHDRHGGPFDRGSADAYYQRPFNPHYYEGDTYSSPLVEKDNMTAEEVTAYAQGYKEQHDSGVFKC